MFRQLPLCRLVVSPLGTHARPILWIAGAAILLLSGTRTQAQTAWVFVAPTGSDTNPGTIDQPFRTVAKGIQSAPSGGSVALRAGTYREGSKLVVSKPITLQNYNGESVTISGDTGLANLLEVYGTTDVTISGVAFDTAYPSLTSASGMVTVNQSQRVTIAGNTFSHSGATGFEIGESSTITVRNNTFADNGLAGMATWGNPSYLTIENNTFKGNNTKNYDKYDRAAGIKMVPALHSVFRNNLVTSNQATGVWCDIGCQDVEISGNTVSDNAHYGIHYEISSAGRILNNTVQRNSQSGIYVAESSEVNVAGNIIQDNRRSMDIMDQSSRPQQTLGVTLSNNKVSQTLLPEFVLGVYDLDNVTAPATMSSLACDNYSGLLVFRWGNSYYFDVESFRQATGQETCVLPSDPPPTATPSQTATAAATLTATATRTQIATPTATATPTCKRNRC